MFIDRRVFYSFSGFSALLAGWSKFWAYTATGLIINASTIKNFITLLHALLGPTRSDPRQNRFSAARLSSSFDTHPGSVARRLQ